MTVLQIRIPEERLPVLIGTKGETKAALEKKAGVALQIDREDQMVVITAPDGSDPWGAMKAKDVVQAIGRGFSPERAFRLLKGEMYLTVLDMKAITGKRDKEALRRIRSRLIGTRGRAREHIEELSGCSISVYGATVTLIGTSDQLERGTRAITMLLRGSEHSSVFGFLEHVPPDSDTDPEPKGDDTGDDASDVPD